MPLKEGVLEDSTEIHFNCIQVIGGKRDDQRCARVFQGQVGKGTRNAQIARNSVGADACPPSLERSTIFSAIGNRIDSLLCEGDLIGANARARANETIASGADPESYIPATTHRVRWNVPYDRPVFPLIEVFGRIFLCLYGLKALFPSLQTYFYVRSDQLMRGETWCGPVTLSVGATDHEINCKTQATTPTVVLESATMIKLRTSFLKTFKLLRSAPTRSPRRRRDCGYSRDLMRGHETM